MKNPAYAVVHLTIRRDKIKLAVGTGILYMKDNKSYIVTAWHNISGRHTETLNLLSKKGAIPNNIIASINIELKEGQKVVGYSIQNITIQLTRNDKTTYFIHSQGYPKVDVVAIPIDLEQEYIMERQIYGSNEHKSFPIQLKTNPSQGLGSDVIHMQDCEFKSYDIGDYSETLYVSDDIFIIGYPKGITDHTMQPIWKRATIATSPHLGWEQQEQFLVDCASREGMSGAPAIYYSRDGKINTGSLYYKGSEPISIFHGIYVGRIGSTSEFEAQIGKVWKRKIIDEIIEDKINDFLPEEFILSKKKIEEKIKKDFPSNAIEYAKDILNEETSFRYIFLDSIMRGINGRANPDNVLDMILEYAKKV